MPLDRTISYLRGRITLPLRTAFFACFFSGYLVHLFAFSNIIPNSDGLSRVFDLQQMTVSGRWFLHYASVLNNFTQSPALIGLLSMLFLSLTAVLIVSTLGLRSRSLAAFAGIFLAVFPFLGYTFLYMFTASAYCLAIFLAALSIFLAKLGWRPGLFGMVALAFSMGIYQAYGALAISLAILLVLKACLSHGTDWKSTTKLGLRLLVVLAAGAALYYGILQLFLKVKGLELLDYLGMNETHGGYPLAQLPALILSVYKQILVFFFLPGRSSTFTTPWMAGLHVFLVLLAALCFFAILKRRGFWKEPWRLVGSLVMLGLLPLGIGFAQIISPFADATPIMKYPYVLVYLGVLLVADLGLSLLPRPKVSNGAAWGLAAALIGLLIYYANINNLLYTVSEQAHRATLSYATRLLSRIESCPGYTGEEEVVIVGSFPIDRIYAQIENYPLVDHYSVPINTVAPLNKHIYYYFNDWLNVPIAEPEEDTFLSVSRSAAFQKMPLYPAEGSVVRMGTKIVVKIQEEYTPKQSYEIAYDNRS